MVTIRDSSYLTKSITTTIGSLAIAAKQEQEEKELQMNRVRRGAPKAAVISSAVGLSTADDVPLLVSDNEDYSDNESACSRTGDSSPKSATAESVKRELKIESSKSPESSEEESSPKSETEASNSQEVNEPVVLSNAQFVKERTQLMTIVVKYMASKINNSFPPESTKHTSKKELPLEKFLLILTSRLNLSLQLFMQGMIYLFRYMDIVYLLRYLNQTNNFVSYNEMQFSVKKLIIGCFKITLKNHRINKLNWEHITGLQGEELDNIVGVLTSRMNGKLSVKQIELVKMKSEIFRFVKMVTEAI
ncbi:hypothetical protein CLIB1423_09S01904 [[Candida] railenensis]|uniref:Uncharacterized protein n=1 Tax=[Candida] railenensis TaxID=45579 RepID=A0A9P0VYL8_9ASCO|nr:hypothetical protein CLIB1423_09S01904 [[Candida] railenensis]